MKKFRKILKNEDGQALVLGVLIMVIMLGVGAILTEFGIIYITNTKLQNTADAAALAGAKDLPNAGNAQTSAVYCAALNGIPSSEVTVTTPYDSDPNKIQVVCARTITNSIAEYFVDSSKYVPARAVAQSTKWAGEALPFINLDGDGEDSTKGESLEAWDKTGPGDKERINNDDLVINTNSIKVKYEDGFIEDKKGKDKGQIMDALDNILVVGKTVYLFSIKHDEMENYEKKGSKELKEGDQIPLSDVVLLECKVTYWAGGKLTLEFVNSYDISTSGVTLPDGTPALRYVNLVE